VGAGPSCAVTAGDGIECWGPNTVGELGNNSTALSSVPVQVAGLTSGVTTVAAGRSYACALTTAGAVECWGDSEYGHVDDFQSDAGDILSRAHPTTGEVGK
jgi:alpha-tubulin suppressor-like RCC1 family protein